MIASLLALASAWANPWWDTAWSGRLKLSFDHSGPAIDDVVVRVRLEASRVDLARLEESDLRFVDDDGQTLLAHEVERWAAGEIELWVRVPRIDGGGADHVWLYYDHASAASVASGPATWPPDVRAVYHLDDPSDSTGVAPATAHNGASAEAGHIGRGFDFDGSNDHLTIANQSRFDLTGPFTVQAWARWEDWASSDWNAVVAKGDQTWRLARAGGGDALGFSIDHATGQVNASFGADVRDGAWRHYVAVLTGSEAVLYLDGAEVHREAAVSPYAVNDDLVAIGHNLDFSARYWEGDIDEVRVVASAWTPERVALEHRSQDDALIVWCNPEFPAIGDLDLDGSPCDLDCDDADPAARPDSEWYADLDGDGFGAGPAVGTGCDRPADTVSRAGDCDDGDPAIHPDAGETCDGVDQDCDGATDEDASDIAPAWQDADGDGWGAPVEVLACPGAAGTSALAGDCDDGDPDVRPGAVERCDGVDDDCDGIVDEGAVDRPWYADADGDGWGDPAPARVDCAPEPGEVDRPGDCDDDDPALHPDAEDPPGDGIDQDCDGADGPAGPTGTADTGAGGEPVPPMATGCGCRGGPGPAGWIWLAAAAARRRR